MTTNITESISPNFDITYGAAEQTANTFTCRVTVIHRTAKDAPRAEYTGEGESAAQATMEARSKAIAAIASVDGPLILPGGPEDEQARRMRLHRQKNFAFTSEPVRGDFIMFEGERVYRFTQNGYQETAVLSLAPHEARQLFDRLGADFGFCK